MQEKTRQFEPLLRLKSLKDHASCGEFLKPFKKLAGLCLMVLNVIKSCLLFFGLIGSGKIGAHDYCKVKTQKVELSYRCSHVDKNVCKWLDYEGW